MFSAERVSSLVVTAVLVLLLGMLAGRSSARPTGAPIPVWTKRGKQGADKKQKVKVDHGTLVLALRKVRARGSVSLLFDLEDDSIECEVRESSVMAPGLAEKFGNLGALMGRCSDDSTVILTIDTDTRGSFKATIRNKEGHVFYADHDTQESDLEVLSLVRNKDIPKPDELANWSDEVLDPEDRRSLEDTQKAVNEFGNARGLQLGSGTTAYKFRIAIVANTAYSNFHGNTIASVLAAIVATMARVNGVFLREMGVMFELVDDNDQLICLSTDTDSACTSSGGSAIWALTPAFMSSRGVDSADYDIGHSFTRAGGGVAVLESLCNPSWKYRGTTGLNSPTGEVFAVDLVSHEIGHQLKGYHAFRDCAGDDANLSELGAVEPGSGTSIMSYSGICGVNNVQSNADPYFNSKQLVTMRDFVESQTVVYTTCGEDVDLVGAVQPIMETADTCVVPKGNYVQLGGSVGNLGSISGDIFYAWDRVDSGYADYTDTDVPRFAPRFPTTRSSLRFLPNMYILSFGTSTLEEIEPKATDADDIDMTFRFIGRTSFSETETVDDFDVSLAGMYGYKDMALTYSESQTPLQITSPPAILKGQENVTISWTGGTALDVEILVAINTMTEVTAPPDFEDVVVDLDWILMGSSTNDETEDVEMPVLSNPGELPLHLMIRSGDDECYFFDLETDIVYEEPDEIDPTGSPSSQPSTFPSSQPSSTPSEMPSSQPSHIPSSGPSSAPSQVPTSTVSATPSNIPTEIPQGTAMPSKSSEPTGILSATPSTEPSSVPTEKPTEIPSSNPSSKPTDIPSASPSTEPSSTPTDKPTKTPSSNPSAKPTGIPSATPSTEPSSVPTDKPTEAPSSNPSSKPTGIPSTSPTSGPTKSSEPSSIPTDNPTSGPTISQATTSCAQKTEFTCGYTIDDDNEIVPGFASVCIYEEDSYYSKCIDLDTLGNLEEGDMPSGTVRIANCGCCPSDDEHGEIPDFCDYKPIDCPVEDYGCGLRHVQGSDTPRLNVRYCFDTLHEEGLTRCGNPFTNLDHGDVLVGCGSSCTPLPVESTSTPSSMPSPSEPVLPSSEPSVVPTAKPSSSPEASSSCAENSDFVCGYVQADKFGSGIVPGYFSACIYDRDRKRYRSKCLEMSQNGAALGEGDRISRDEQIVRCGCCGNDPSRQLGEDHRYSTEQEDPDYCDYEPIGCSIDEYGCGFSSSTGKANVRYCYFDKSERREKKTCGDPFENIREEDALRGCGQECDELETAINI